MKDLEFAKDKIIMGEHAPPLEPITLMRERRQVGGFKSIYFYIRVLVTPGPERRSVEIDKKNKTITAYHESGHAIVAYYTKDAMPINKATIMPRGPTLGHVSARYFSHSLPVTFVVSFLNILFLKTQPTSNPSRPPSSRCPCCQRTTAGARREPSCSLRWTSAWAGGWRRSSSSETNTSPPVREHNRSFTRRSPCVSPVFYFHCYE